MGVFTATHTFNPGDALGATDLNNIQQNLNFINSGKMFKDIFATYAVTWSLLTAQTTSPTSAPVATFTQIDALSPTPGSMAIRNFITTTGRIQGFFSFSAAGDNGNHSNYQVWYSAELRLGDYTGTIVNYDVNSSSTATATTSQGNTVGAANNTNESDVFVIFSFTGLTVGGIYTVTPVWRNYSNTATGGGSAVTTLFGANLMRGAVWDT